MKSLALGSLGAALGTPIITFCLCWPVGIGIGIASLVSGIRAITMLNQPDYRTRTDRGRRR